MKKENQSKPSVNIEKSSNQILLPIYDIISIENLRSFPFALTSEEKYVFLEQFILLMEKFYVHLPLKKSMFGIDPVQQAKILLFGINNLDNFTFLQSLLKIFIALGDLHTNLILPLPWQGLMAFLPYVVGEYYDSAGRNRYIVTHVSPYVKLDEDFVPGVEITHWNNIPIDIKVSQMAQLTAGANLAARKRRALTFLTVKNLSFQLAPEEDAVTLSYISSKGYRELKYPWLATFKTFTQNRSDVHNVQSKNATLMGIDEDLYDAHRTRKRIFVANKLQQEYEMAYSENNLLSSNFEYKIISTSGGDFGYLGIWNFETNDIDLFVNQVKCLLQKIPQEGLIIDVRGNPGGVIPAGERILQFFTSKKVEPASVSFRNTEPNYIMSSLHPDLKNWSLSMHLAEITGEIFSQGFPLTSVEEANNTGRIYYWPVVLIVDALCYSTCDFFVAGFKDHNIGTIIGVDAFTGAGGANVWTHDLLLQFWKDCPTLPIKQLPAQASMRIAMRRSLRVGASVGLPVEGLGVAADILHNYTLNDLLYDNIDLYNKAGSCLLISRQEKN